jgi:hypothetical protein
MANWNHQQVAGSHRATNQLQKIFTTVRGFRCDSRFYIWRQFSDPHGDGEICRILVTTNSEAARHDFAGSIDYLIALHEPINQATNRHLLTAFGPRNDVDHARATLQTACKAPS